MDDINQHHLIVSVTGKISSKELKKKILAVKELTQKDCIITIQGKHRNDKGEYITIEHPSRIAGMEESWIEAKDSFGIQRLIDSMSADQYCQIKIKSYII